MNLDWLYNSPTSLYIREFDGERRVRRLWGYVNMMFSLEYLILSGPDEDKMRTRLLLIAYDLIESEIVQDINGNEQVVAKSWERLEKPFKLSGWELAIP